RAVDVPRLGAVPDADEGDEPTKAREERLPAREGPTVEAVDDRPARPGDDRDGPAVAQNRLPEDPDVLRGQPVRDDVIRSPRATPDELEAPKRGEEVRLVGRGGVRRRR